MKEEITLVVVDCQYDFCNPTGALYVKGAECVRPWHCFNRWRQEAQRLRSRAETLLFYLILFSTSYFFYYLCSHNCILMN